MQLDLIYSTITTIAFDIGLKYKKYNCIWCTILLYLIQNNIKNTEVFGIEYAIEVHITLTLTLQPRIIL